MTDITHLLALKERIDALCIESTARALEANALTNELRQKCTHPTTVRKQSSTPGGYYDRSETTTWDECTLCAHQLNERNHTGGYG